jgi:adenylate cyclase
LDLAVEDLGERALKNIDTPVRAYRIAQGGGASVSGASPVAMSSPDDVALPGRPVVAILPFQNLNSDAESDFVADGIGLGIQTLMVQLPGLFLINASSDQGYREGTKTAAEVVGHLPVRYVLEGTAQRAGQRVRVTVQLTDLHGNAVVWAERYDRDLEDVFALQDEITREVVSSLNIELFGRDFERIVMHDLQGDGAWEFFLRGVSYIYMFSKEDNERARAMFEKLYALRPEKVHGPSYVALTHWIDLTRGWADSPNKSLAEAAKWATIATEYEANDGIGYVIMSYVRLHEGEHDEALALCEQAVEYRANCPAALGQIATVRLYGGDAHGAVKSARDALGVRTMHPPMVVNLLANAYRDNGEIGLSILAAREAARLDPTQTAALATLCGNYVLSGDKNNAARVAQEIITADPTFRTSDYATKHPYKDRSKLVDLTKSLRAAGLPE